MPRACRSSRAPRCGTAARQLSPRISLQAVNDMTQLAATVHVDPAVLEYVSRLMEETRLAPEVRVGVSIRGALALMRTVKVWAAVNGRHYVIPDDVKAARRARLAAPLRAGSRGGVRRHHRQERHGRRSSARWRRRRRGSSRHEHPRHRRPRCAAREGTAPGTQETSVPADSADARSAQGPGEDTVDAPPRPKPAQAPEARTAARGRPRSAPAAGARHRSRRPRATGTPRRAPAWAGLRDRAVALWRRRLHPVVDVDLARSGGPRARSRPRPAGSIGPDAAPHRAERHRPRPDGAAPHRRALRAGQAPPTK
jgi:hypothetical protein